MGNPLALAWRGLRGPGGKIAIPPRGPRPRAATYRGPLYRQGPLGGRGSPCGSPVRVALRTCGRAAGSLSRSAREPVGYDKGTSPESYVGILWGGGRPVPLPLRAPHPLRTPFRDQVFGHVVGLQPRRCLGDGAGAPPDVLAVTDRASPPARGAAPSTPGARWFAAAFFPCGCRTKRVRREGSSGSDSL